jgi:acetyltransferase-like isoleucine patch superfamily enzyme
MYRVVEGNTTIYDGAVLFPNVRLGKNVTIFPGAVIGRPPMNTGSTIRDVKFDELGPVVIGDHCVVGANAVIYMDVTIGHHTMIGDTARVMDHVQIGDYSLIAQGVYVGFNVKIGNRVRIMDNTGVGGNSTVEDDVFIGPLACMANSRQMKRRPGEQGDYTVAGPTIRRHAAIAQGVLLLAGVEVGEDAIIGTGAVVTKNIPPRVLALGVPARVVRDLTPEEIMG